MSGVDPAIRRLLDERAIYRLACLYAAGADRRDPAIWASIMTEDMVLITPRSRTEGRDKILLALPRLAIFTKTHHRILNQLHDIDGDVATGETYCVADHMAQSDDGSRSVLTWVIRYQDRIARIGGEWRFTQRELILDWAARHSAEPVAV